MRALVRFWPWLAVAMLLSGCVAEPASGGDAGRPASGGDAGRPVGGDTGRLLGADAGQADAGAAANPGVPVSAFTKVRVPGACERVDSLEQVQLSVMLFDGFDAILPTGTLQARPVSELLGPDSFVFRLPQTDEIGNIEEPAFARGDRSGTLRGVGLHVEDLTFDWSGGVGGRDRPGLVVLLVDQSGSLIGEDPSSQTVDTNRASDRERMHIAFLEQVVQVLPAGDWLSLISFNGSFPNLTGELSTPTRNREVTLDGLAQLSHNEHGPTPLADALDAALERVIDDPPNLDLNPVVILFTDGVENGDVSTATLEEVTRRYASHQPPVPVIVLHLQPKADSGLPRGRDRALVDLACRSCGEHIFLEQARELISSPDLLATVVNRTAGTWHLGVATTLASAAFPPDDYFLSTELEATLGGMARSVSLVGAGDAGGDDARLWLYK